jgi:hypothetical protein
MDKLQDDEGRVDLSSALWTDEERRIAYRVYDSRITNGRFEFVVDHWLVDVDDQDD